jgi:UDP-3-O-[3-hydroxymyristoyl] glucosamine N-acyltransferase
MNYSALKLAEYLNGDLEGDPEVIVSKITKIEEAEMDSVTFLSNKKYTSLAYKTKAAILVVNKDFKTEKEITPLLIRVDNAYVSFVKLLNLFNKSNEIRVGVSDLSQISKNSDLSKDVFIGAFTTVSAGSVISEKVQIHENVFIGENVNIGKNTIVYSGVKILKDTLIGENCIINSNAVIGSDGFGFAPDKNGVYIKIPQIGNVIIKNSVSVGASTTIDRATLGSTIINEGVKLDNQIQVAHNVVIGKNTVIAAQCGIAGSSTIGENCQIGGQSGVSGHLKIGDNVIILGKSAVTNNVKSNTTVKGSPAFNALDFNKSYVHFKNLNNSK